MAFYNEMGPADIQAVTGGGNCNNGWGGGMWGDWILLFLLFGMYGYGGFGGGFGFGGFGGAGLNGVLTRADINEGFALNNLENGIRGIQQGICDSTYALNNSIMSGFHGVDNAICNLGYNLQSGINGIGHQISDCCCQTQRAIDGVKFETASQFNDTRYQAERNTRDIVENQNSNTRAILDFLTQDKISTLTAENQALKFQASQSAQNAFITANQEAQTAELIRRLGRDCPVPAYVVPNPNCCYGNPVGVGYPGTGYGWNNGGCGCCA